MKLVYTSICAAAMISASPFRDPIYRIETNNPAQPMPVVQAPPQNPIYKIENRMPSAPKPVYSILNPTAGPDRKERSGIKDPARKNPSILDLSPYQPDERPMDEKRVEPATWVEEIVADIGQDCAVNPFILTFLIEKYGTTDTKTVWKALRKCKDNDAVKHIMTIEYLAKTKPELYTNLIKESAYNDGKKFDGKEEVVKNFIKLGNVNEFKDDGTKNPAFNKKDIRTNIRDNLKDWSSSKVYKNMLKWKAYNDFYNGMELQQFQYWKRKVNDYKEHKKDAADIKYLESNDKVALKDKPHFGRYDVEKGSPLINTPISKLEQFQNYAPFLQPFIRKRGAPIPRPVVQPQQPVYKIETIIPQEPMPVAVSVEEQQRPKYLPVVPAQPVYKIETTQ